jgi:urease beta subunit
MVPGDDADGDTSWMLLPASSERRELPVENTSRRVVRVSSHYPFDQVNPRLVFDRARAAGFHLDIPAGSSERWGPGETRTARLVRYDREGHQTTDPRPAPDSRSAS